MVRSVRQIFRSDSFHLPSVHLQWQLVSSCQRYQLDGMKRSQRPPVSPENITIVNVAALSYWADWGSFEQHTPDSSHGTFMFANAHVACNSPGISTEQQKPRQGAKLQFAKCPDWIKSKCTLQSCKLATIFIGKMRSIFSNPSIY